MARISQRLRRRVTERARGLCEYCQTPQLIVVTMEVDHIVPEVAQGKTVLDNLCLTCRGCNSFKQDHQTGFDSETQSEVSLFNPRTQKWTEHFEWSENGTIVLGLTAIGRATIARLRMNREGIIAARRLWVEAGWHPPGSGTFSNL